MQELWEILGLQAIIVTISLIYFFKCVLQLNIIISGGVEFGWIKGIFKVLFFNERETEWRYYQFV